MKIFISADIEGVTGITHWDETEKGLNDYEYFKEQMTKEVRAACEGALRAGATEIWIKDAHDSGRNIIIKELPKEVKIIRGWSGHPFSMVQEINESFDGVIFIGYHSPSASNGNPLSHTMHSTNISEIKLNGIRASEFMLHSYTAESVGVPSIFISGDKKLMEHAKSINANIRTLSVNEGIGNSTISVHPELAEEEIRRIVEEALKHTLAEYRITLPDVFELEIEYVHHFDAYKASFYPGAEKLNDKTIKYVSNNYFDIMRAVLFLV